MAQVEKDHLAPKRALILTHASEIKLGLCYGMHGDLVRLKQADLNGSEGVVQGCFVESHGQMRLKVLVGSRQLLSQRANFEKALDGGAVKIDSQKSADPLSLDKVVRRVVIADPSCFLPYRDQNLRVCGGPTRY